MNTVRYISLLSILIFLFAANAVAQQEQATDVVVDEIPLDSAVYETMHGNRDAVDTVKEQIRSVMREKDGVKVCFRIHPAGSNATVIYWKNSSASILYLYAPTGRLLHSSPSASTVPTATTFPHGLPARNLPGTVRDNA